MIGGEGVARCSDVTRVEIRDARPEDGDAVRRFVLATFADYGMEPDLDGIDRELLTFGEHGEPVDEFVALVDGRVVGSVMVSPSERGGWLSKFFVDKGYRGLGVGRQLLARAVKAARRRAYRRLDLDTRDFFVEAIHLYESTGWTLSTDRNPSEPCDAAYSLELEDARPD
jgi:GNAT superfamily N-acetyltransferase